MKRIYQLLIIATLMLSFVNCKREFLDVNPQNGTTFDNNFFKKTSDFYGFLLGAYHEFNGSQIETGIGNWITTNGRVSQDITKLDEVPYDLNVYMSPTQSNVTAPWGLCYKVISRTNLLLEKLVSNGGVLSATNKDYFEGEAKFLRGFSYFSLAQRYGNVPLFLKSYDVSDKAALSISCSTESQVWDQVILDLTQASQKLPPSWGSAEEGRVTKGSALAYLANAYIYKKDWVNAKKASDDLIALGKYSLLSFSDLRTKLFSPSSANTAESIFELQYGYQPGGTVSWSIDIPDYGNLLNVLCTPLGSFSDQHITNAPFKGQVPLNMKLANSYDPTDKRRLEFVKAKGESYKGEGMPTIMFLDPALLAQKNSAFSTKWWIGPDRAAPTSNARWFNGVNIVVMRYAEFLLNYAEILFELGNSAGAYTNLNLIRARAGLADKPAQSDREIFFTDLMNERRWELTFEPNLWMHYTRTKRAAKFFMSEYGLVYQDKWLKYPIPQIDRDLNPNLCQNPGY